MWFAAINIIKRFLPVAKWVIAGIFVLAIMYFIYDYGQTKEQLTKVNEENSKLKDSIENIVARVEKQQKLLFTVRKEYDTIEQSYVSRQESLQKLSSLSKEELISKKDEVQTEINSTLQNFNKRMLCITSKNPPKECLKNE